MRFGRFLNYLSKLNQNNSTWSIMSRKKVDLSNLRKQNSEVAEKVRTENSTGTSSPYFSPLRTRNQRKHIQLQYEKDKKGELSSDSVNPVPNQVQNVKQEIELKERIKEEPSCSIETAPDLSKVKKRKSASKTVKKEDKDNFQSECQTNIKTEIDALESSKQSKWMPKNWEKVLENMRIMRSDRSAPVDTMGCHKCSDDTADEKTQRFHHLIALMLSSQTKDQVTFEAMRRLKAKGLTPQTMVQSNPAELEKLLCPVSFYKTKAKHIQKASQILIDQYDSDIPPNVEELIKLPGVGPKMAHICMKTAWDIVSGIGVDTHVHRISNRLRWLPTPTKEPEQTRIALEKWIPFELWSEINEMMVGFGQTVCTPTNPKCGECLNYDICPSRVTKKK